MSRPPFTLGLAALAAATALATPALAAPSEPEGLPHVALYVGPYAGYNLVLDGWDLNEAADAGVAPGSSLIAGLRLGVQATSALAFELGAGFIPYAADGDASGLAVVYRGDVLVHPFAGRWSPYVALGAGLYQGASGDFGADADWELHWGLGLRGLLTDWIALRVEARHNLTDSYEDGLASLVELTVGLDLFVWGAADGPPPDSDRDGVPDAEDACRTTAGPLSAKGCPDFDNDGVKDEDDKCAEQPGPKIHGGCPDTDGDGQPDDLDRCPDKAGPTSHDGCPPPPPDTDGDGLADPDDACADEAGPADTLGCPDQDGDGILDKEDRCPAQPGVATEGGCLPQLIEKKFTGAIRGIVFATASARIQRSSFKLLDEAAAMLLQYPSLRLEVSGHTDNQGVAAANLALSQQRADAVRQYLVDKGVDASRLTAVGFGADKPVASNGTPKGRAENRRIEFRMLAH